MSGKPLITFRPDSLGAQVIGFFRLNHDEELTLDDIATKFDVGRNNIHTQLGRAVDMDVLVRDRNVDGDYVYKRGKALAKVPPVETCVDMDAMYRSRAAEAPAPVAGKAALPEPADVAIDDGVPIPGRHTTRQRDWSFPLLKLQVTQSFMLPIKARASLQKNITALHKAGQLRFEVRVFKQTEELRVWRVA